MTLELLDPAREADSQYERLRMIAQSWRGETGRGIPLRQTGVNSDSNYAGDFANGGSGGLALRATAGSHSLTVTSGGVSLSALTVSGNLSVLGSTTLGNDNSDATTIQGSLTQSGGAVSLSSPTTVSVTATGAGTLTATSWSVTGPATLASALTAQSTASLQGNVTVRNGATGATLALFDASNTRLLIGSGTALASASNDLFAAIGGRAYVAAGSEDRAIGLRYNATSGTVYLGASNSATLPSLIVKDHGGVQVAAFNDSTATVAQLAVTGDVSVSDDAYVAGDSCGGKVIAGATAASGSEVLRAAGASRLEGIVSVIGATVDLENNRSYRASDGTTQRNLAKYDSGGVAQFAENGATGAVVDAGYVQLKYNGTVRFEVNTTGIGAYGASPVAKPTVVGSRGANAALASLITALANIGWVTDLSTV